LSFKIKGAFKINKPFVNTCKIFLFEKNIYFISFTKFVFIFISYIVSSFKILNKNKLEGIDIIFSLLKTIDKNIATETFIKDT
jgi:hypothetical protein